MSEVTEIQESKADPQLLSMLETVSHPVERVDIKA